MDLLAEGIESQRLPCSLVLLIPALGIVLMGRRRTWLIPAWIVAVTLIAWLRFTGWWTPQASGIGHIISGIMVIALAAIAWKRNQMDSDVAATVGVAFVAGWTWIPCVGSELGDILNNARAQPWVELIPTLIFFLGLFLILVLVAAAQIVSPRLGDFLDARWLRSTGLAIIVLVGALVAVTLFDDVASELARRSSF